MNLGGMETEPFARMEYVKERGHTLAKPEAILVIRSKEIVVYVASCSVGLTSAV